MKNIYETEEVRLFAAAMSPLSQHKYNVAKEELERGIARSAADLKKAMAKDPSIRRESDATVARYAALELLEGLFRTAAGSRRLNRYRADFHRDFTISISLDGEKTEGINWSSKALAYA